MWLVVEHVNSGLNSSNKVDPLYPFLSLSDQRKALKVIMLSLACLLLLLTRINKYKVSIEKSHLHNPFTQIQL